MPRLIDDPLALLRENDRKRLLLADSDSLIGMIMELNRASYYHNRLDALRLASLIVERRARRRKRAW